MGPAVLGGGQEEHEQVGDALERAHPEGQPDRLEPPARRARLLGGSILQSDETSVRVGKRNWWTWVFHHGDDCCFVIRPSRGKDVVAEFLGDVRPDFWVSDRFGAQMGWAKTDNQVCLAHSTPASQSGADP